MTNTQIKELPSPYGDCESSEDYVKSKCLVLCNANYVIEKCNCKDVFMPGENKTHIHFINFPVSYIFHIWCLMLSLFNHYLI